MAKLVIVYNEQKFIAKLVNRFTGGYAYHTAWAVPESDSMYDMHLIRRIRNWPYYNEEHIELFDFPEVTEEMLFKKLKTSTVKYSLVDYVLFAMRPIYALFGKTVRNAGGEICSEACNNDLIDAGVRTFWTKEDPPPSPIELRNWAQWYTTQRNSEAAGS